MFQDLPRLLDAPNLKSKHAKVVSCGARHSAVLTGVISFAIYFQGPKTIEDSKLLSEILGTRDTGHKRH